MAATITTPFGHSLPPEGPHTITLHAPKWESAIRFRDKDMSLMKLFKSVYPRFFPFGPSATFIQAVGKQIGVAQGRALVAFVSPDAWASNRDRAVSVEFRKENVMKEDDMKYHVVDVDSIRLYLVEFPMQKMMSAIFMWQHGGVGFSTRMGEYLLTKLDTFKYLGEFPGGEGAPEPTYLPENQSHELLRKRISGLLMRATVEEYAKPVTPDDVYLYQTGMAGITRFHETVTKIRPYAVVVFGAIFHSSWHLFEESAGGIKHYGKCDNADLDAFEKYLEDGGKCSYVFTEFPSNPILVSVDLVRLRKLADKHDFFIAVDDTISSFCNIDLLPAADAIITSLSKSFSGYADLLAGSVALNPNRAAAYATLKPLFTSGYHNEFFGLDADQLLKNSDDYLPRSQILNRNAAALASYFASQAADPAAPVTKVCYPPHAVGSANLRPFQRRPSPELPEPGYGCLLSVELATQDDAIAFYDALDVHQGPHLGAHLTLAMPYNAMIVGADEHSKYHESYGLNMNQIRFSVGLEDAEVLVDVCRKAVAKTVEAAAARKDKGEQNGHVVSDRLEKKVEESIEEKSQLEPMGGNAV